MRCCATRSFTGSRPCGPDGRPHVTPLIGVWWEGALHFTTGASERKARNLAANPHCVLTTGVNSLADGLDVVVEGCGRTHVTDLASLAGVADAFVAKYGPHFAKPDGTWAGLDDMIRDGEVMLFRVAPGQGVRVREGHDLQRDALAVLRSAGEASPTTVTGVDRILVTRADF